MEMRKCPNGHYYDASVHASCPYCANGGSGMTLPLDAPPIGPVGETGKTVALTPVVNEAEKPDDGRTVALIKQEKGIDPVVGWLVCIEGAEKGKDYRIHSDNNYIGRSDRMDICIRGDETISRENHAILSYDTVDNKYYFSPGDGRAIVRMNGNAIFQTQELKKGDRLTIGKTTFYFVPMCDKEFMW